MLHHEIPLAKQVGRVPSTQVPLDSQQELRFRRLMDDLILVDVHQHPMVAPEDIGQLTSYLRSNRYSWAYQAVEHGGWTAVTTANMFRGLVNTSELSFVAFEDVLNEVGLMVADVAQQGRVRLVSNADQIEAAKQEGKIGFLPTLEHLAIGNRLERVDTYYGAGIRLAGITYTRKNFVGDGQYERNDGGLSEFGIEVVRRMNQLGMAVDVSHASYKTAMDAIRFSEAPVTFSHNAAYALRPTLRARKDDELLACAQTGGLIGITAVPNSLSDDPNQNIDCVLDHYDYLVSLLGIDQVAIGSDTMAGDHVAFHRLVLGRQPEELPAQYLDGLESPADGKNIVRGLIRRGYSDQDIRKIAGGNALAYFRRVMD